MSVFEVEDQKYRELWEVLGRGVSREGKIDELLEAFVTYGLENDAEILYLFIVKKKSGRDIAVMEGISFSAMRHRLRRVFDKAAYIEHMRNIDVDEVVEKLNFVSDEERKIIGDMFKYVNQARVGRMNGKRQSTVRWILAKAKTRVIENEKKESEKWYKALVMFKMLEMYCGLRLR